MKKTIYYVLIAVFIVCVLMCALYFFNFTGGLSLNSSDWGAFGSYLGSITGLLAFVGVLYSIQQSNKAHTEDSERDTFFKLLDLHTSKMNSVEIEKEKGAEAFKKFVDIANKHLNTLFLGQLIQEKCNNINKDNFNTFYNEQKDLVKVLNFTYNIYLNGGIFDNAPINNVSNVLIKIRNLNDSIKEKECKVFIHKRYKDDEAIIDYLEKYIDSCSDENKYNNLKIVADFIYKEYGYILGHYFRNMYYVMGTINDFSDKKNYDKLFRAQLSRYELALAIFNAVSSHSSLKMVQLLESFDIFKDVFPDDLTFTHACSRRNTTPKDTIDKILLNYKNDTSR